MSINRTCRTCGQEEPIRFNFGDDWEAEREFHSQDYFCEECKASDSVSYTHLTLPTILRV